MKTDCFPISAAVDALLEITHALFNVTDKHIIFVDLLSASLDDLVADLGEKALHSFWGVVENTDFPNNSNSH